MPLLLVGGIQLLCASGWSEEQGPAGGPRARVIPAEEQVANAELVSTWAPGFFWDTYDGELDEDCQVLIGEYFPFPNPMSVPAITITVFATETLLFSVVGQDGSTTASLKFNDVERGAYFFRIDPSVWQSGNARLRLECAGGGGRDFEVPRTVALGIK